MCSFILTDVWPFDLTEANSFISLRGPDLTTSVKFRQFTLVHNLLSITGPLTPQPFIHDDVACLYNGQIYNYRGFGEFGSDGECLLPAYLALGPAFVRELDGEFAIAILDARQRIVLLASDPFGTKPLYYAVENGHTGIASYASALASIGFVNVERVPPNRCVIIDLDSGRVCKSERVFSFDLEQWKTSFDDWMRAFQAAIWKRSRLEREKLFICLSSGYDSGAIACELDAQDVAYKSYSIANNEDLEVLMQRLQERRNEKSESELIYPSESEIRDAKDHIERHIEPVRYDIRMASGRFDRRRLHEDGAATGLSIIFDRASRDSRRVHLSGQGADEIMSDYGFGGKRFYGHSHFGGLFPECLAAIFPWPSFFGSTQASYLIKDEYVAGSFGIETRYPFLDRALVQEFLWLSAKLKNWRYKSALRHYLDIHRYPTLYDRKLGFVL
jgi:asparagine synthetase B (glutamine-hydrolysing)